MAHIILDILDTSSGLRWANPGRVLLDRIIRWRERARLRSLLAGIDDRSLRDAGIDPGLATYETAQPFWRPITLMRNGDSQFHRKG